MKGTMITIRVDGTVDKQALTAPPTLDQLKARLHGGWLEHVPFFDELDLDGMTSPCVAFCDEEGKIKQLPINEQATSLWDRALLKNGLRPSDVLVGPVVIICGDRELLEEV